MRRGKNMKKINLPKWAKILIPIISVVIIIFLSGYIYLNSQLNKVNRPSEIETVSPEDEFFEVEPEDEDIEDDEDYSNITWPTDGTVLRDKNVVNILLIGQDRRPGETRARSDSMMIASIHKKNKTIKITSLMRDMYVQIPGYSDNRINAAYAFGGMRLLNRTIEKNFMIHIDGNIEVDFDGFKNVIDKIGGIEITVNADEAAYLVRRGYKDITAGKVKMNGALALEYSRIRYVGHADYERTERQRLVMTTAFNKIKGLGLGEILSLIDEILPLVTTDMSNNELISLATSVFMMKVDKVDTYRLPIDGAFTSSRIRGMAVLVPDLGANRAALKEIIFE